MKSTTEFSMKPVAVVTGASSGIGYELAKVFAKNGYDLIIAADSARILTVAQDFREYGANVEVVQTDLSSRNGVQELCDKIEMFDDRLDAVAINAGVGVYGKFEETDLEDEMTLMGLNIIGVVQLSKFVVQKFVQKGHGRMLFTSSIAADMPGPYYAVYAASKAFVQSFAEALHNEVMDRGITVTALQPGPTDTRFFERAGMQESKASAAKKDDPENVAQQGFDALMAGKDHVVAGSFMNKVQATIAKFASEPQKAAMQENQIRPQKH